MAKKAKSAKTKSHLPEKPPKRTGKRGVGPLDAEKDFKDAPGNTKENPPADGKADQEPELLEVAKTPTPAVQHGKMAVHFIDFRAKRAKDRSRLVTMRFSLDLEDAHTGRLAKQVEDEWRHFKRGSAKLTQPEGMGAQNVELSMASDTDPDLAIVCAMPKAVITRVQQKGKGATRKVIRLEMHFLTSFTDDVARFCRNNSDETCWMKVEESQRSFGDGAEE